MTIVACKLLLVPMSAIAFVLASCTFAPCEMTFNLVEPLNGEFVKHASLTLQDDPDELPELGRFTIDGAKLFFFAPGTDRFGYAGEYQGGFDRFKGSGSYIFFSFGELRARSDGGSNNVATLWDLDAHTSMLPDAVGVHALDLNFSSGTGYISLDYNDADGFSHRAIAQGSWVPVFVPEPASAVMMMLGFGMVALLCRRTRFIGDKRSR